MVDIYGPAIGKRHAAAGDHNDAEKAGGYVAQFVAMRVVQPEDGTGVVGTGSGAIGNLPGVGVG